MLCLKGNIKITKMNLNIHLPFADPALETLSLLELLGPFFTRIRLRNLSDDGSLGGCGCTENLSCVSYSGKISTNQQFILSN
jgi:hypothetical protein